MCGVAGWCGNVGADASVLQRMTDAIVHRGPDSGGAHVDPGHCALGFRRLSIIDLHTGRPAAGLRGRLRRRHRQRRDLQLQGAARGALRGSGTGSPPVLTARRSPTPTRSGATRSSRACAGCSPSRCGTPAGGGSSSPATGWARSRMYYAEVPGGLLYASEPAAILASGLVPARPDPAALRQYLALQYVPPPLTGFAGIRKLAPGELLVHEDGRTTVSRYWDLVLDAAGDQRRGRAGPARRAAGGGHAPAARRRRPARRVPVGRHRLEPDRVLHGRRRRPDADVLHRLRRGRLQRGPPRPPRRGGLRHRARGPARGAGHDRDHAGDRAIRG